MFEILYTEEAESNLYELRDDAGLKKRYKAVKKALKFLGQNPKHPSLQTHPFTSLRGPNGEKVFEAYAENQTPSAYRIFWYYGPQKGEITVVAITSHP